MGDPDQPADVRFSAALAWLSLVDDPIPDDLRGLLTAVADDELADLVPAVPWLKYLAWDASGL
ncbi:hypothetical protein ACQEU3_39200 [Spirillospora sp. CA-253888]